MQRSQVDQTYQTAWTIAKQLPLEQRRVLAHQLLDEKPKPSINARKVDRRSARAVSVAEVDVVLVALQQLSPIEQLRIDDLMTRNSDGEITSKERAELTWLVDRFEQILLANSSALLRATQPQLFNNNGTFVSSRAKASIRKVSRQTR